MSKPFSEACARNAGSILRVLSHRLSALKEQREVTALEVLEIGSGTGQHAVYFASELADVIWHCSDRLDNHSGISQWVQESGLDNIQGPIWLDVAADHWPDCRFDMIFSANTAHIMRWTEVEAMIEGVSQTLEPNGELLLYGPFKFKGQYTSDSNAQFDEWLKTQAIHRAIRDFEAIDEQAKEAGLRFDRRYNLPANNQLLVWTRID